MSSHGCARAVAAALLALIVIYVIQRGGPALNGRSSRILPTPVGVPGGGVANAVVGSIMIIAMASVDRDPDRRAGRDLSGAARPRLARRKRCASSATC